MRIVFVQAGLGAGGAEKNISVLAQRFDADGDDVHVVAMNAPPGGAYFPFPETVTVHLLPRKYRTSLPRIVRHLLYIRRILRLVQPDVVVSFLTKINVLTVFGTPFRSFPIVASERNNPRAQKNNSLWRYLNLTALSMADSVVMLTRSAAKELPDALRRKAAVIYVPCMPAEDCVYCNRGQKRIVAVGRLDQQKGFDLLIRSFSEVLRSHPDATLTIFGEGKERMQLEALLVEQRLTSKVRLPGVTKRKGKWIEEGDIFVFSSRHEGFGNALAEATVAGMPSISFDCDYGPREIIDHEESGLLVPTEDISGLAKSIVRLLDDPELQSRFSSVARARNSSRFDPDTIYAQWRDVVRCARR